jgi:pimeloyl-ACP methyl ester carboxylesterase
MAEVVLFHHVQGLTDGVRAFAAELRAGGHNVHTPDLFDGERPATIDDGVAYLQSLGDKVLDDRAERAVAGLPDELVYAGFSWGAATAQRFAQTRPGAGGALLYEACIPITGEWALRALAQRRNGADPRHGQGPVLRPGGRHRRCQGAGSYSRARARRAVRLSGRPALVHRQFAAVIRRRGHGTGDAALAGVPRPIELTLATD